MTCSPETAVAYAALILQDSGIEITAEGLSTILSAANVEIDSIWCTLFAKVLAGKNLNDLLFSFSAAPAVNAAPVSVASAAPATAAGSKSTPAKKEPEPEPSDEEMGFGLFD